MRFVAAALLLLSLGACAEVTTFRRPDGSTYHHVNCGDSMKLESCRHAAGRTCSNGFTRMNLASIGDDSAAQRCISDNQERRLNREPEQACPPMARTDNYFVCK
ncbi:hypothetical protein H261_03593 [Paramagnetospirillum caucaseum]|uniref:Lipoprotein n=1 Tax=Paramagnetospirillum caucaseum TaxID=1244869 RepID=M2YEQ1_9PROT|nr:hypothetical protein [Paramagnetospirillum caucaseum]EME71461.1 hypothetical protein H261_03593 [Paramagnetospirillum caucaseum]